MNFRRGNIGLVLGGILAIAAIAVAGFFLWQGSQNTTQPISEEEKSKLQPPSKPLEDLCDVDSECYVGGCNSEYCTSGEARVGACYVPKNFKSPKSLGLKCGCVENKCQWRK